MSILPNSINPGGGGNPLIGPGILVGTAIAGGSTIHYQTRHNHHKKIGRFQQQQIDLKKERINPAQFVAIQALDGYKPKEIESSLQAWGGNWQDTSFENTANYSVEAKGDVFDNNLTSYKLVLFDKKLKQKSRKIFSRRGGATAEHLQSKKRGSTSEAQVLGATSDIERRNMNHGIGKCLPMPNTLWEISEEKAQDREVWKSYTTLVPSTPFLDTRIGSYAISFAYLGGVVLVFALGSWVARRFGGRSHSPEAWDKQELNAPKRPHVTLESRDAIASTVIALDSILRILMALHNKAITRDVAIFLLKDYHCKTEEEAVALVGAP